MSAETKASLRGLLLGGAAKFRREELTVDLGGGPVAVEVRQPSVNERSRIMRAAGVRDGKGEIDLGKLQVAAVLACVVVPGTVEKVFEASDEEALLALPAGGGFDELATKALELLNVDAGSASKK